MLSVFRQSYYSNDIDTITTKHVLLLQVLLTVILLRQGACFLKKNLSGLPTFIHIKVQCNMTIPILVDYIMLY